MDPRPVVTIGNFDGVHVGHRALLDAARSLAGPAPVVVLTFDPSPRDVMQPGHGTPAIQGLADRVRTLREAGADAVEVLAFTRELASWPPERFVQQILADRLHAAGVVVGWDFRFGRDRAGDADLMQRVLGVPVVRVGAVQVQGEPASSTRVRKAVQEGDLALATQLLARPHEVIGPVVQGDQRGRRLGIPTANVVPTSALLPPRGVYAVRVRIAGRVVLGVANLGDRPTVGPGHGRLEVHLLDFQGDLYGQELRVELVGRLRDERVFPSLDALVAQIHEDIAAARHLLGGT